MVQAADFRQLHDPFDLGRLDPPDVRRILIEREVSAGPVIVREVRGQDASQVALAENNDMVQALAPHRADEALSKGILPRPVRGREDFLDTHVLHALMKRVPVDVVTIAKQIGG
jgi:hypothetical protein